MLEKDPSLARFDDQSHGCVFFGSIPYNHDDDYNNKIAASYLKVLIRSNILCTHKLKNEVADAIPTNLQATSAVESATEAKEMALEVLEKSRSVCETSKRAIDIARKQRKAKETVTRATEKALRTFR